ncbi:hypothetical protein CB1_000849021 [Camelus ferus]|nr:hypothetical protein CB1_000849021 [Camelus ferus]
MSPRCAGLCVPRPERPGREVLRGFLITVLRAAAPLGARVRMRVPARPGAAETAGADLTRKEQEPAAPDPVFRSVYNSSYRLHLPPASRSPHRLSTPFAFQEAERGFPVFPLPSGTPARPTAADRCRGCGPRVQSACRGHV